MGRNQTPADPSEHEEKTRETCDVPTFRPGRRCLPTSSRVVSGRHVVLSSTAFRRGPTPTVTMPRGQGGGRRTLNLERSFMDDDEGSFAHRTARLGFLWVRNPYPEW